MEAVVRPPKADDLELSLLVESPGQRGPRGPAWIGSLLLHALGIGALLLAPRSIMEAPRAVAAIRTTPLIAPPETLTQKAPNRGKIGKEFTLENLQPRPRIFIPPSLRRGGGNLGTPVPQPAAVPEPPRMESTDLKLAQAPPLGSEALPPAPPQIQTEEKPKLAFETPGAPSGRPKSGGLAPGTIAAPSGTVSEATRAAIRGGGGGVVVGDPDLSVPGGLGPGLNLPSAPGRSATALELLSDPHGVDFRPYLIRILAAVKRNWLAVIPESARLGRQGKVQVQFAIARDGHVPKLVIAMPSGTDALDRAAVAGISASNPFPPLPTEFQGNQVRLQFTFLYNVR